MLRPGLVSVTFRNLEPEEIVALVASAGLAAVEWGGDVHVPHGDTDRARRVGEMTRKAGLRVAAYGSYYRVADPAPLPFRTVVETAAALGAPVIRVWAGSRRPPDADEAYWRAAVDDSRRCADLAAAQGVRLAFEYHGNTLTETPEGAVRLLESVAHSHVGCYWQRHLNLSRRRAAAELRAVLPWLAHVHANYWSGYGVVPLAEHGEDWMEFLKTAASTGRDHCVMIEFVQDGSLDRFRDDARALTEWLDAIRPRNAT